HAFAFHRRGIVMRDCAAAAAKNFDAGRAALAQKVDNFCEKFHVPTVITGNADGAYVFLDRCAHDITDRAVIAEINDLNPVPDEFEIDRVYRAIVSIAYRNSSENSDR